MTSERPEATQPTAITADRASSTLVIVWVDGATSQITFDSLRWNCPCAVCRGEGGQPGLLTLTRALTPDQIAMVDLRPVGLYAVSPLWQDGHDTGIYPFTQLRKLGDAQRGALGEATKERL